MGCAFQIIDEQTGDTTKTCQFEDEPLIRTPSGKAYCQFHLPMEENGELTEKAEWDQVKFENLLSALWSKTLSSTPAKIDFSGTVFPRKFTFFEVLEKLRPEILHMKRYVRHQPLESTRKEHRFYIRSLIEFDNCTFHQGADFSFIFFEDGLSFQNAKSLGNLEFNESGFNKIADFSNSRFTGESTFKNTRLPPNLEGCDFQERLNLLGISNCNLRRSQFNACSLSRIHFHKAHFLDADITNADLQDADLSEATGLVGPQFAGTNVSGAKLPPDILKFEGLKYVEEVSKHARTNFLAMLAAALYVWLTVGTATDFDLLVNSVSSPLPILQASVPIKWFFLAASAILLGVFVYLHLYLQRMWEGLADLPAIFPDGRPIYKVAYPWLLNSLMTEHVEQLKHRQPPFSMFQRGLSIFAAYWLVPLTLFGIWLRLLPLHEVWPTTILTGLVLTSVWCGIRFYRRAIATLQGKRDRPREQENMCEWEVLERRLLREDRIYKPGHWAHSLTASLGALMMLTILWVFQGPIGACALCALNLRETSFATEDGQPSVPRDLLIGRNLRYAVLEGATFFDGQSLADADLSGATLSLSKGRRVKFEGSRLVESEIVLAELPSSDFVNSDMSGAIMSGSNFRGSIFIGADLSKVLAECANFSDSSVTESQRAEMSIYTICGGDGDGGV